MSCRGISTIGRSGFAALVALAFCLFALPAVASADDGGISGKVTLGGSPVPDQRVCAVTEEFVSTCVRTEATGTYEITELPPDAYFVEFQPSQKPPYVMRQYWPGVRRKKDATQVVVTSGATTPGIDAAMIEGGAIAGTVTDAFTGAPIPEVDLCLWTEPGRKLGICTHTSSAGTYRFFGVEPASYKGEFIDEKHGYEPELSKWVSVSVGVLANGDVSLVPGSRISGHVSFASGNEPAPEVLVCALEAVNSKLEKCTESGPDGTYLIGPLAPGAYKVAFSPELQEFLPAEPPEPDGWPTQFWNLKSTLSEANVIDLAPSGLAIGIDGLLGYVPPPSGSSQSLSASPAPAPVAVTPAPKPLVCKKGFVKKRVKGVQRCVKRHKPHHRKKHRSHR